MSFSIQKANFWKRISAYIFDALLAVMIAVGFATVFSHLFRYDDYTEKMHACQIQYVQEHNIKLVVSKEAYDALSEEDKEWYITQEDYNALSDTEKARYAEVNQAFGKDPEIVKLYKTRFQLTFAVLSLGIFSSHFICYFLVPLFFKNGQTLGKKCFGLAVVRTNCVKMSNTVHFIRSMVGLYAMETMVPVFIVLMVYFGALGSVGTITLFLFFALQILVMTVTQTNSSIHDLLSDTVVVDMASQKIFETQDALIAYKQELAAAEAAKLEQSAQEHFVLNSNAETDA